MSFNSSFNPHGAAAQQRRAAMLDRIAQLRAIEDRAAAASARSKPVFDKRGQLLPRERVALLLDAGATIDALNRKWFFEYANKN